MGVNQHSAAELVAAIGKTSFPILFIEGTTDRKVFRRIQKRLGVLELTLIHCGSRNILLEVFNRRNEFFGNKAAFFADRDLWYFSGIPTEYSNVIFTYGYSIENDLFHDGKDQILRFLDHEEKSFLDDLFKSVSHWYAFEIELALESGVPEYSKHSILNPEILPQRATVFHPPFLARRGYFEPSNATIQNVLAESFSGIQGKIIFDCIFKTINDLRDKDETRYSHAQLHDICILEGTDNRNPASRINQIIRAIQLKLQ